MSEWAVLNQGPRFSSKQCPVQPTPTPLLFLCLNIHVAYRRVCSQRKPTTQWGCERRMWCFGEIYSQIYWYVYLVSEMHPEIHQRLLSGILKKSYFTWLFSTFWLQSCWPWWYILHLLKFENDAASWWISLRAQWRWGNPQFSSVISDTEASENEK